ncbi:MAG: Sulfotransferase family protein [Candidatus Nitrotoga sp. SPKER]|nr:MAG: Sulfotransferase family protein [Candidatus Nitrotoga sp. SPKER]
MSEFWLKVEKTLEFHSSRVARKVRGAWWDVAQIPAYKPIFIVGCSRAGTTVVYKTFSESHAIGSLNRETHDFWVDMHPLSNKNWDTHALDAMDASNCDRDYVSRYFYTWTGQPRFVDKNNQNGLCVPYLYSLFPDAHFVYVKRSPGDNINSLIEGWDKPGEFATWSNLLPQKISVENGRYTQWCFFLANGWRDYINASIEEVCAFQYSAINQAILDAQKVIPVTQWSEVFYEDIVRHPKESFQKLFEVSGLPFDLQMQMHCENVLDTPYNAFSEIRLDKWKEGRNRSKIEQVLAKIEAVASAMGYKL